MAFAMPSTEKPSTLHPMEQAAVPAIGHEDEADPGLGRKARYLQDERAANGGLSDDPTESGAPVVNRKSFTNLKGGR
jgi:hypothetical protein